MEDQWAHWQQVPPITISHIRSHDKGKRERKREKKKKKTKNKSLIIYLNSKRKHEASDVESS